MKDYVKERIVREANYVIKTGNTVRETAKKYGVSKSTVHRDLTKRLATISILKYHEVNAVLQHNKAERHIRGGLATKQKYAELKRMINTKFIWKS